MARAAFKEKRHPYPIGSLHDGKMIVGREILRDRDGKETLTGLYLEEGKRVVLQKLITAGEQDETTDC
jgi:hypothetical protein